MAAQTEKKEVTYILYRNGRAKVVSREAWERAWLGWWKKTQRTKSYQSRD